MAADREIRRSINIQLPSRPKHVISHDAMLEVKEPNGILEVENRGIHQCSFTCERQHVNIRVWSIILRSIVSTIVVYKNHKTLWAFTSKNDLLFFFVDLRILCMAKCTLSSVLLQ